MSNTVPSWFLNECKRPFKLLQNWSILTVSIRLSLTKFCSIYWSPCNNKRLLYQPLSGVCLVHRHFSVPLIITLWIRIHCQKHKSVNAPAGPATAGGTKEPARPIRQPLLCLHWATGTVRRSAQHPRSRKSARKTLLHDFEPWFHLDNRETQETIRRGWFKLQTKRPTSAFIGAFYSIFQATFTHRIVEESVLVGSYDAVTTTSCVASSNLRIHVSQTVQKTQRLFRRRRKFGLQWTRKNLRSTPWFRLMDLNIFENMQPAW